MSTNRELAGIFREMALMLELEGVEWKPRAYEQAAFSLEELGRDVRDIYAEGGAKALDGIPSVGEGIAKKIVQYIEKGRIKEVEKLRKKYPPEITGLISLEGLGPKKVMKLIKALKIKTVEDLRKAAERGKVRGIPGFGAKAEQNLLDSLSIQRGGRMLLSDALSIATEIVDHLKDNAPLTRIDYVGSTRRMKETVGDIDVLVVSEKPQQVMGVFTRMGSVQRILAKGTTKSSVLLKQTNTHVDVRVVPKESYAGALNYFTGSKEHNVALRKEAISKGWKLSEYGLFERKSGKQLPCRDEAELYRRLGMAYIEPEMREMRGEIELAKNDNLPKLITVKDIRGDLHTHTKYTDGANSVEEMARAAQERGYEYLAVTDHSKSSRIAGGMEESELKRQWKEIDRVSKKVGITILKGSEVDILKDGSLDYSDGILKKLDVVIGSVHSSFKMPRDKMTARIIAALENERLDILGHPTGRLINKRAPYEADWPKIFKKAADSGKVLEINSQPSRLDLNDALMMEAKKRGCKFSIGTDAASTSGFDLIKYGVGQARRAWLTKGDVINTLMLKGLKDTLGAS